jgi:hypothetical protein
MPRKPDGLTPRSEMVTARFRPTTVDRLDKLRGNRTRTRLLEDLINQEWANEQVRRVGLRVDDAFHPGASE